MSAIVLTIVISCCVLNTGAGCNGFARLIIGFYYAMFYVPLSMIYMIIAGALDVVLSALILLVIVASVCGGDAGGEGGGCSFQKFGDFVYFPWRTDFHKACRARWHQPSASSMMSAAAKEEADLSLFRSNAGTGSGAMAGPHAHDERRCHARARMSTAAVCPSTDQFVGIDETSANRRDHHTRHPHPRQTTISDSPVSVAFTFDVPLRGRVVPRSVSFHLLLVSS